MEKSLNIQRLCTNVFSETPPTTTEQQSTAVWDNTFVFFWEFPTESLTESTVESTIVGFGGILFAFEINSVIKAAGLEASRHYLVTVMSVLMPLNISLLLIGTMSDCVEELQDVHPSMLMSALTENLKKRQLILTSGWATSRIGSWPGQVRHNTAIGSLAFLHSISICAIRLTEG
jgi:hypothetical protein